jgi:hypothetical protein
VNLARLLRHLLIAALAGAVLGAAGVIVAFAGRPTLALDMDKALPRKFASGLYDSERVGDLTFAWTSQRADIKLDGVSRRTPWTCSVRFRGGRSDLALQPVVDLAADGVVGPRVKSTNDFQEATIVLPPRPSSGGVLTISASATLVPGPGDPRQLGVQIDRIVCAPSGGLALPPVTTMRDAAIGAAVFGLAFVLAGATLASSVAGALLFSAAQALPLASGPAPYTGFAESMRPFAFWIALLSIAVARGLERWRGTALQNSARFVILFSAAALDLKLLGLLHPSKLLVDAVFHAHRFEWVLAGKYYFTQGMPSGVSFPYAIGLYVFAAPWSLLFRDHVSLLRVVVCAAEVVAGALLYPLVVRAWNDRVAAALAVVLVNLVPLQYGLLGNANLTNAFGEAVALATVLVASLMYGTGSLPALASLFVLASLAFLSHVSTFALLGVTLTALAVLYRALGDPALHRLAWTILAVSILSALVAVALYYGHFGAVYKDALRVRANSPTANQPAVEDMLPPGDYGTSQNASLSSRIVNAVAFAIGMIGWPIVLLSLVGAWRLWVDRARDRATLAILAWTAACLAFLAVAVMRVDAPFQRYAAEFFGRVLLATFAAAILLAARGTAWAWRTGLVTRLTSALLVVCAVILGIRSWMAWFL